MSNREPPLSPSSSPAQASPAIAPVIAIDGPAGAGKSTVARRLAQRLGLFLLDTGALYRGLALAAREAGIPWDDDAALARRARTLRFRFEDDGATRRVYLDERDVTAAIRTPEISDGASRVSALPEVRAALLQLQRDIAASGGCVVEGRDIGTVVLPDAPLKFFLTASDEERARRRYEELRARGEQVDLASTLAEQRARDRRDESRAHAPLRQAEDAERIDSSRLGIEEVLDLLEARARARFPGGFSLDAPRADG